MAQSLQRVVDSLRRKQGQRLGVAWARHISAVGNTVIHGAQIRQIKHIAHQLPTLRTQAALKMVLISKGEVHRDRLRAGTHLQLNPMVLYQQRELLEVILGEQVGARECGLKTPGAGNKAIAQASILQALACHGVGLDAHKGVAGPHMAWQGFACHKAAHGAAQVRQAAVVNLLGFGQGRCRITKT